MNAPHVSRSTAHASRILVRGVNWLGDAVMSTPALLRLRERFPEARITLLTTEKKIILIGNLTKDSEVRYAPSGTPVATVRLAVTTKQRQGEDAKDDTLFIDVVVFGRQAEICGQYLGKGQPVLVEGRLRERKWESEGTQKSKFEVIDNAVRLLPRREGRQPQGDAAPYHEPPPEETTELEPF